MGKISGEYEFGNKTEKVERSAGGDRWALGRVDAVTFPKYGTGNDSDYGQFQ